MISMFVWGFLVLMYPNMILAMTHSSERLKPRAESALNQMKQMWDEFDRERKHFLANDPVSGEEIYFNVEWTTGDDCYDSEVFKEDASTFLYYYQVEMYMESFEKESEPNVSYVQDYFRFLCPRTINTAEQTWLVRKPALENAFVQPANTERILLKLSPLGLYDAATQAWVGTDLPGVRDFFDAARQYRQTVINYFFDNNAFGARQWFSADNGAAEWGTLPQFSFQRVDVGANAKRALPDVCLLLMTNLALFMAIFLIFQKSAV